MSKYQKLEEKTSEKTWEYIDSNSKFDLEENKYDTDETFVLMNEYCVKYSKKCLLTTYYDVIRKQTLIPGNSLDYFIVGYKEIKDDTIYKYFSSGFTLKPSLIEKPLLQNLSEQLSSTYSSIQNIDNRNFVLCLQTLIKFHIMETYSLKFDNDKEYRDFFLGYFSKYLSNFL